MLKAVPLLLNQVLLGCLVNPNTYCKSQEYCRWGAIVLYQRLQLGIQKVATYTQIMRHLRRGRNVRVVLVVLREGYRIRLLLVSQIDESGLFYRYLGQCRPPIVTNCPMRRGAVNPFEKSDLEHAQNPVHRLRRKYRWL